MIILSILMLGDVLGGTLKALETHTIKSAISKRGLLDKLKIFICLLTVWLGVEILSFATDNVDLKGTFTILVITACLNELNSILELLGSKYTKAANYVKESLKSKITKKQEEISDG